MIAVSIKHGSYIADAWPHLLPHGVAILRDNRDPGDAAPMSRFKARRMLDTWFFSPQCPYDTGFSGAGPGVSTTKSWRIREDSGVSGPLATSRLTNHPDMRACASPDR